MECSAELGEALPSGRLSAGAFLWLGDLGNTSRLRREVPWKPRELLREVLTPGPSVRGWGPGRGILPGCSSLDRAVLWAWRADLDGLCGEAGPRGEAGLDKEFCRLPSRLPDELEPEEEAARDLAELRASKA